MVFVTVVLHGFSIGPLANLLGLSKKGAGGVLIVGANTWSIGLAEVMRRAGIVVTLVDKNRNDLRPAKDYGILTHEVEPTSEEAEYVLDHARFDTLIAVSGNEHYNALVCRHYAPELGRHKVYQLSAHVDDSEDEQAIRMETRGRTLMRRGRTFKSLMADHRKGWVFSRTELTDDRTLEAVRDSMPEIDLIAELRPNKSLLFLGPNRKPKGGVGTVLIGFGPGRPNDTRTTVDAETDQAEPAPRA